MAPAPAQSSADVGALVPPSPPSHRTTLALAENRSVRGEWAWSSRDPVTVMAAYPAIEAADAAAAARAPRRRIKLMVARLGLLFVVYSLYRIDQIQTLQWKRQKTACWLGTQIQITERKVSIWGTIRFPGFLSAHPDRTEPRPGDQAVQTEIAAVASFFLDRTFLGLGHD